jgi:hypothetical protein
MLVAFALQLAGCHVDSFKREERILRHADEIYEQYWSGDMPSRAKALGDEIRLLENSDMPQHISRKAFLLFVQCSRLYVLQSKLGNSVEADFGLVKAHYWNIRRYEVAGPVTPKDVLEIQSFTKERIVAMVEKADKDEDIRRHALGQGL